MGKVSEGELALLLIKAANNLNNAGFNDSVGRLLLEAISDLSKPIPEEDVRFLNQWCYRLELTDVKSNPIEVFDLISDLSQIMKRYIVAKSNKKEEPNVT
tara:strand:+ start:2259 stop:2558 length:300 start_codon:yes stop_codon:yes gene_type:complete